MFAIALLGGLMVLQRGSGAAVIPLLGALALGAQRLLPALQQVYSGWAVLKGYSSAIQAVLDMLNQPLPQHTERAAPFQLKKGISFQSVTFRYAEDQPDVLKGLNLEINCGECIGVIGSTGSGKSTTVDLLMGLLEPTAGRILLDGNDRMIRESERRRLACEYFPCAASIYLADSSIAENMAFGVPSQKLFRHRSSTLNQIASFIETTPEIIRLSWRGASA